MLAVLVPRTSPGANKRGRAAEVNKLESWAFSLAGSPDFNNILNPLVNISLPSLGQRSGDCRRDPAERKGADAPET